MTAKTQQKTSRLRVTETSIEGRPIVFGAPLEAFVELIDSMLDISEVARHAEGAVAVFASDIKADGAVHCYVIWESNAEVKIKKIGRLTDAEG